MKLLLLVLAATLASSPAQAQEVPYKLVLVWTGSTVVVDYPTGERCLAAVAAIEAEEQRLLTDARRRTAGTDAVFIPVTPRGFCIPG